MLQLLLRFFCFLFMISPAVYASEKTFVIGVQNAAYSPLYHFPDTSHTKELLDAFAESKGYTFTYLPLPLKRINYWYQEEVIDFKYPDSTKWSQGRSFFSKLTFSDPAIKLVAGTMVRKGEEGRKREDIATIGTLFGFHATMWSDQIATGKTQLIESPSVLNIVKQVLYGHIDATNIEQSVVNYYLKILNKEGALVIDKSLPHEVYTYQLSTVKYPYVIDEFNTFLKENQPFLEALRKQYNIIDTCNY